MSTPKSDISIPVLTQILGSNDANAVNASAAPGKRTGRVTPVSAGVPSSFEQGTSSVSPDVSQGASGQPTFEGDWKTLELKLNERVLDHILRRIDFVVEHRVKKSLADAIESTTDDLIREIRRGLHVTMEDVIRRAVAQEIAKVQSAKE